MNRRAAMGAAWIVLFTTLVVALVAASVSCTRARVRGSGNVVACDVAVSSFSRLEVASAFEVAASVGGQPSLTLRVDDNLERHVEAGVSGDTLRIGLRRGTSVSDATLQATITAPSLVQVRGSGASRIRLQERVAADDLGVELSGTSRLDGAAELGSMTAGLSGAAELALSGREHVRQRERRQPAGVAGTAGRQPGGRPVGRQHRGGVGAPDDLGRPVRRLDTPVPGNARVHQAGDLRGLHHHAGLVSQDRRNPFGDLGPWWRWRRHALPTRIDGAARPGVAGGRRPQPAPRWSRRSAASWKSGSARTTRAKASRARARSPACSARAPSA
jgi:hypothetical protein